MAVKDPLEDTPLQPVSALDSMYYGQQQPEQALAPVPQPQPAPPRDPVVWDQPRENESWWDGFRRRMREGVRPEQVQNRLDTVSLEGGNDILPESTKTVSGQALKTGLQEAHHDISNVTDPFKVYEKVKIPPELEKQLRKDVVDGWSDPNWWVAQGLYGLAKNAPTLVGMGVGAIVGATPGAAIGGALTAAAQNLQPAYQRAREEGLEHEEAKKRAIAVATVDAAFTASMALAPQLGVTVKALEKPIAQALSQVLLMQGQDLAVRTAEDKGLPTTREAATNLALGTMMAAPMLKAAKIPMLELDPAAIRSGAGTFGGQIFASELAKKGTTKPLETLELAQKLEKQGKSPEDIWQETSRLNMAEDPNNLGWFRGKDGEWRFEVNDQATFNKEGPDVGRLTDSYRNPPVEKAIDLGDITLTRNPKEFGGEYNADFISPEIGVGTRAYTTKTQNPNIFGKEWSPRSVTSHEVQHFIQDVEKWQNGSNPDAILKGYYGPEVEAALKTRQLELYRGALEAEPNAKLAPEEHQRAMLDAARKDAAHELYEKVAGEVEARNVQTRLDMTPEERLAKRPELTEDVPRDQQILDPVTVKTSSKAELTPEMEALLKAANNDSITDLHGLRPPERGELSNMSTLDLEAMTTGPLGKLREEPWEFNKLNQFMVNRLRRMSDAQRGIELEKALTDLAKKDVFLTAHADDISTNKFENAKWRPWSEEGVKVPQEAMERAQALYLDKNGDRLIPQERFNALMEQIWDKTHPPGSSYLDKPQTWRDRWNPFRSKSEHREKTAMEELREKYKAEEKVPEQTVEDVIRRNEESPPTEPPKAPPPADTARIVPSQPKSDPLTFDKFYTMAKDDLHPIRRMEEALLEGRRGTLAEPDKSPYILSRLTRGLEGRVQQAIRYNMYRFKDHKNVGPGLEKILEPIKMKDREAFEQYLVYKRTLELEQRGIKTGFDPRNAADFVRKNAKQFDETAKKVTRFAQQGLEYLRDSGVISKDAFTRMTESNKDYVPFYRLMEDGGDISSLPNTLRNPVKEIKGSERDVISPLESIVRNTYAFIGIAERNRALNAMKDLADANPTVGKQLMQRMVGKTEMEALKKAGKDTSDLSVFKPDTFHPAKDEIVLFRNGERQTYKVAPEVAEAVKNLNREELNWVVKAAAMPARWLRAGATLAPEFIARNPIRDQFSASILSNNNYIPLVSLVEGFVHAVMGGRSPQYQAALKGGGFNANLVSLDRKYINDNLMRLQDPTTMGRIKGVITSPVEALRKMSELMENATRMGEFLQARRAGKSVFSSAYDMREVTLDFARMGAKGRAMNAITAFWNANLEGTDRLGRAMWENPRRTAIKALSGIALPSALLWWATRDDERMKEVPKWERDTFWVIPMDDWQPINADKATTIPKAYKREINGQWFQNKGEVIKIPKPFTEGILLGSGTERGLEALYGNDPKAWKNFGKSIKDAVIPGLVPTGALPILETGFGKSWFLDRDIVPKYLQRVDPKEQHNPYTSETAKFLGRQVAKVNDETSLGSPLVIEHIYRGYTGGLGRLGLEAFEKGLELTGVTDKKDWPTNKNADIPLLRAFASRHPSSSAESIQQFYDEYEKREKAKNTAKLLDTRGDTDGARKIREERALANATSTHRQIGAMNKEVRRIYDDKKLSPDDKREQIDLLYLKMINLAQKANEMFRATEKKPQAKPVIEDPFKPKIEDPFKQ